MLVSRNKSLQNEVVLRAYLDVCLLDHDGRERSRCSTGEQWEHLLIKGSMSWVFFSRCLRLLEPLCLLAGRDRHGGKWETQAWPWPPLDSWGNPEGDILVNGMSMGCCVARLRHRLQPGQLPPAWAGHNMSWEGKGFGMLRWVEDWRSCSQVQISRTHNPRMAGYLMPSNFHLLILIPQPPGTFKPRESHAVHAPISQLSEFLSFSTAAEKPSGMPWGSQVSIDTAWAVWLTCHLINSKINSLRVFNSHSLWCWS